MFFAYQLYLIYHIFLVVRQGLKTYTSEFGSNTLLTLSSSTILFHFYIINTTKKSSIDTKVLKHKFPLTKPDLILFKENVFFQQHFSNKVWRPTGNPKTDLGSVSSPFHKIM